MTLPKEIAERVEGILDRHEQNAVKATILRLNDLLDRYWDIAYAEGAQNRQHDTEGREAQRTRAEITAALDDLKMWVGRRGKMP